MSSISLVESVISFLLEDLESKLPPGPDAIYVVEISASELESR